jgi:TonB family protein
VKEGSVSKKNHSLLRILLLAIALSVTPASRAQTSAIPTDTAISQLAFRIADPLQKLHATKIVFADLKGPDGQICPPPQYSAEARRAKIEGTVVLQVVITTDGRAINIKIVRDPGNGLAMKAVESVRKWKFKPAVGPDGNPIAVVVPIEVTFRSY